MQATILGTRAIVSSDLI